MLKDSTSWQDELSRGLAWSRKGRFARAVQCFERARKLAPDRPETACALGRERMRSGDNEQAVGLLQAAWEHDHSLQTAGTSLARCLGLGLKRFNEAHQVLDQVDEHHGPQPTNRLVRGEILLEEGRHEEASIIAEELQAAEHEDMARSVTLLISRIENERGLCAAHQGAFERAIFAFKRASDLDPKWAAPLSNLGAAFDKLGKAQRAESAYRQACELDHRYGRAWHNLGKLYERLRDPRSLESFERAYLADMRRPEFAADYAAALERSKAVEIAEEILDAHAKELGDLGESWANLAIPLAASGSIDLAEMCVRKAHERCSDDDLRARLLSLLSPTTETTPVSP